VVWGKAPGSVVVVGATVVVVLVGTLETCEPDRADVGGGLGVELPHPASSRASKATPRMAGTSTPNRAEVTRVSEFVPTAPSVVLPAGKRPPKRSHHTAALTG
jgi:hypothetical protein